MLTKIFDIAYEIDGDMIDLEQDMGCGEVHRVTLHRIHLRHLVEQAGLEPASSATDARTIAGLSRQVRLLADRIDKLDTMMLRIGEKGHECVDEECAYSAASVELAQEFVDQLPESNPPKSGPISKVNNTESGTIGNATKRHATPNAERQKRYRERRRNAVTVTPVTGEIDLKGTP